MFIVKCLDVSSICRCKNNFYTFKALGHIGNNEKSSNSKNFAEHR